MRIASLVLGIAGILLGTSVFFLTVLYLWIPVAGAGLASALAGFITGALAKYRARRDKAEKDRLANAGFIVSLLALVEYLVILLTLGFYLIPAACAAA